jgi:flagellin
MALTINTNIASLNAQRNLGTSQSALNKSMQRLSSGLRINSAKDDAAGLAISDRMTSQIRGLNQAGRNANDGISMAQTAEGALQESTNLLQRMRELAVQSANDTNTASDRSSLQAEVSQLVREYDRIATQTQFNGQAILDGTQSNAVFQVGANANQTISVSISDVRSSVMGNVTAAATLAAPTAATTALLTINGVTIGGTSTTTSGKVTEINAQSSLTGVTASQSGNNMVSTTALTVFTTAAALAVGDITINGVAVGAVAQNAGTTAALQVADVAAAINLKTGDTGVTATVGTGSNGAALNALILSNTNGDAITVGLTGNANSGTTGLIAGTVAAGENGKVTLATSIGGSGIDLGGTVASIGFIAGSPSSLTTNLLSAVSVNTRAAANNTILVADAALSQVSSLRGNLGAVQNRFESTIANLQNVSENLSAARSRILDADIAQETSNMTKQNILQQAGVAILAQANQAPQLALSLLK